MVDASRRNLLRGAALAGTAATAGCLGLLDGLGGGSNGWRDDWVLPKPDTKWQTVRHVDHSTIREHAGDVDVGMLANMGNNNESLFARDAVSTTVYRNGVEFLAGDFDVERIGSILETERTIDGQRRYVREDPGEFVRYEDVHYGYDWFLREDVVAHVSNDGRDTTELLDATLSSITDDGETLSETDAAYAALVDRLDAPTVGKAYRYEPGSVASLPWAATRLAFPKTALASGDSVVVDGETASRQRVHVFPDAGTLEAGRDEFESRDAVTRSYAQDDRLLVANEEFPTSELNPYGDTEDYDGRGLFAVELTDDDAVKATYVDGPELSANDVTVGVGWPSTNLGDRAFEGTVEPGDTAVADELDINAGARVSVELEDQTVRGYCWDLTLPVRVSD